MKSKYANERRDENRRMLQERSKRDSNVPDYLKDEEQFKEVTQKDY